MIIIDEKTVYIIKERHRYRVTDPGVLAQLAALRAICEGPIQMQGADCVSLANILLSALNQTLASIKLDDLASLLELKDLLFMILEAIGSGAIPIGQAERVKIAFDLTSVLRQLMQELSPEELALVLELEGQLTEDLEHLLEEEAAQFLGDEFTLAALDEASWATDLSQG